MGPPLDGAVGRPAGGAVRPQELSRPAVRLCRCDSSQAAGRCPLGREGIWATLTPGNNKCLITLGFYSLHLSVL